MRLGSLFGIRLVLNPWFFVFLIALSLAGRLRDVLVAFALVTLHEGGHAWVARRHGLVVSEIELLPFGGVARIEELIELDPDVELAVAAAGPLTNACLAALALLAGPWLEGALSASGLLTEAPLRGIVDQFVRMNLWLAGINLVPALPLDGGRLLRARLARRRGFRQATLLAVRISRWISAVGLIGGGCAWYAGYTNPSSLVLAAFLFWAAGREGDLAAWVFMRYLARKGEELAKDGCLGAELLVAADHTPVKEVLRHFAVRRYHLICVLDREGTVLGVATEREVIHGWFERGIETRMGDLVRYPWRS